MRAVALVLLCGCSTLPTLPGDPWWYTVSRGGSGAAWAERRGREVVVHHDGDTYGPYP